MADPKTPPTEAQKREMAEIEAKKRIKAAKQASKIAKDAEAPVLKHCKVLHLGDGRISTGEHVAGIGEVHYEEDETFEVVEGTADKYKSLGWVQILP